MRRASFCALAALLGLGTAAAAQQVDDGAKRVMQAIMLKHAITLDTTGLLHASAGIYVKMRDDPAGDFYAGGHFAGAGHLEGGTTEVFANPTGTGSAFAAPGGHKMWYIQILNDGMTVCGADISFSRMACTKTDAIPRRQPAAANPSSPPAATPPK